MCRWDFSSGGAGSVKELLFCNAEKIVEPESENRRFAKKSEKGLQNEEKCDILNAIEYILSRVT